MIERIQGLPENALGYTAKGTVSVADYESVIIPAVDALFIHHDHVRFLYHLGDEFAGFEAGAAWDDAKLGLKHLRGWERIAVVSDVTWVRAAVNIFGLAIPGQVRLFRNSELAEAKRWISASD